MRFWQVWWRTLILYGQHDPPRFVELVMLLLALPLLLIGMLPGLWRGVLSAETWSYLVLGSSYLLGASASILSREIIAQSPYPRLIQLTAVLLFIIFISWYALLSLGYF